MHTASLTCLLRHNVRANQGTNSKRSATVCALVSAGLAVFTGSRSLCSFLPRTIYRSDDCTNGTLDPRPACRGDHYYGDIAGREILLILQVRISGDEDTEPFFLGVVEQLPVLEFGPAALVSRHYLVLRQNPLKWDRSTLVEQYAHSGGS